jgi:hypothetical protein
MIMYMVASIKSILAKTAKANNFFFKCITIKKKRFYNLDM